MSFIPKAVVFDIEGTITDIRFVTNVLFPFARRYMPKFLSMNMTSPEVIQVLADVRADMGNPLATIDDIIKQLDVWMELDQKIGSLKTIQGMIWRSGYKEGHFKGDLYSDVIVALNSYKALGISLYIYSSGSVEAQKLLLQYSVFGDITHLFSGFFDTTIGAKTVAQSYIDIAKFIDQAPDAILFFSDNPKELAAASAADFHVIEVNRNLSPTAHEMTPEGWHVIGSFEVMKI